MGEGISAGTLRVWERVAGTQAEVHAADGNLVHSDMRE